MIVIGVTGGVGTGKSTVSQMFAELGAFVLDADRITYELMAPGTSIWKKIKTSFGKEILASDRKIDRRRLAQIVFHNPADLRRLSSIIHPVVRRKIKEGMAAIRRRDRDAVVVLDVPLLIEAGSTYKVDV